MSFKDKKVFLVDDDVFHIEIMKRLLHNEGFVDVVCFKNSSESLNNIHLAPRLVFVDHQIDNNSNLQTVIKFKKDLPNAKIIVLSAWDYGYDRIDFFSNNKIHVLQKNINLQESFISLLKVLKIND
jgi:CheY-like chemotaxis protein